MGVIIFPYYMKYYQKKLCARYDDYDRLYETLLSGNKNCRSSKIWTLALEICNIVNDINPSCFENKFTSETDFKVKRC